MKKFLLFAVVVALIVIGTKISSNIEHKNYEEMPNNKIFYTSTDGQIIKLSEKSNIFGANIISNTNENGKGLIMFDGEITTIGNDAFKDCENLMSIILPNSITSIEDSAFWGCKNLISITIPDSVNTIGRTVFYGCQRLNSFNGKFAADNGRCLINNGTLIAYAEASGSTYIIPENVTAIRDRAFFASNLTSVTITDGVTTIGDMAFGCCSKLTSVTIPNSITSIGSNAFISDLSSCIENVYISDIAAWCNISFDNSSSNPLSHLSNLYLNNKLVTSLTIPENVTKIGDYAFFGCRSITNVSIHDNVATIGERAFSKCERLKEFKGKFASDDGRCLIMDNTIIAYANTSGNTYTIPENVTNIGDCAFIDCKSLKSVTIGDGVTSIGMYAFSNCGLTNITIPNSVTSIGKYAFYHCTDLTNIVIGKGITTIEENVFSSCDIENITIPNSVTTIGNDAFSYCYGLKSITIPESVTKIGKSAFYNCRWLTSITIPNSVTTIEEYAFSKSGLTSITIPDSVTAIGGRAFEECSSLIYVYCKATTPPTLGNSDVFTNNASGRRIIVPIGSGEAYKTATYWKVYANVIFEDVF